MDGHRGGSRGYSAGRAAAQEADAVCSEKDRKGLKKDDGDRKDNRKQTLKRREGPIMLGSVRFVDANSYPLPEGI